MPYPNNFDYIVTKGKNNDLHKTNKPLKRKEPNYSLTFIYVYVKKENCYTKWKVNIYITVRICT